MFLLAQMTHLSLNAHAFAQELAAVWCFLRGFPFLPIVPIFSKPAAFHFSAPDLESESNSDGNPSLKPF